MRTWPYSPWWGALSLPVGGLAMFAWGLFVPEPSNWVFGAATGVLFGFVFLALFGRQAMRKAEDEQAGEMPAWQKSLQIQVDEYAEWNRAPMNAGPEGSYPSEETWAPADGERDAEVVDDRPDSAWTEEELQSARELDEHLRHHDSKPPVDLDGDDD